MERTCEGCHIGIGNAYIETHLVEDRGKGLCSFCVGRWEKMEVGVRRKVSYLEFTGWERLRKGWEPAGKMYEGKFS